MIFLLAIWYLNKWLLNSENPLKKLIGLNPSILVGNILVIMAIGSFRAFRVEQAEVELPSWLIMFRLALMAVILNVTLRVFKAQKTHAELKFQNLRLQADNLKFQIETLKQQINPHFLFNSLNTLLDLVEDSSEKASDYIRSFSNLYRAVLQSSKLDFIQLRDELKFLDDYWKLLKMRFGDSIQLDIEVDESKMDYLIPPLSLQLLVENAVKHNEATKQRPLSITIKLEKDDHLIISNLIRIKAFPENSERVGLKNLQQRFTALHKPISYGVDAGYFIVKLPLKTGK